eukprot:m.727877 g.727877  ORF g.727877 m.727877 type:complete len:559 (+) comp23039_c0_seq1:419-2095(+)
MPSSDEEYTTEDESDYEHPEYSDAVASDLNVVLEGFSNHVTAMLARYFSQVLESKNAEKLQILRAGQHLLGALSHCCATETSFRTLDLYIATLTGLRYMLAGEYAEVFCPRARPNAIVLQHTAALVSAFCCGYETDPNGYAAPEIVSMWSSLVNDESAQLCRPYLKHVDILLEPCMRSASVGSIVAILLASNLKGSDPAEFDAFVPLMPKVMQAFSAAFSGNEFEERQWGPGPLTNCLSKLSVHPRIQGILMQPVALRQLVTVIASKRKDWEVSGFDDEYYVRAAGSACRTLANLVLGGHDITQRHPELEKVLSSFAKPMLTRTAASMLRPGSHGGGGAGEASASTGRIAQSAQADAVQLLYLLRRHTRNAHALPAAAPPQVHRGTVVVLALGTRDDGQPTKTLRAVASTLVATGLVVTTPEVPQSADATWHRHDAKAISHADAVIVCLHVKQSGEHLPAWDSVRTVVTYAATRRIPCICLVDTADTGEGTQLSASQLDVSRECPHVKWHCYRGGMALRDGSVQQSTGREQAAHVQPSPEAIAMQFLRAHGVCSTPPP